MMAQRVCVVIGGGGLTGFERCGWALYCVYTIDGTFGDSLSHGVHVQLIQQI
jgi:hypothetical protein